MGDPFEGLAPLFSQQLQALIAASGGRIRIESGYRSIEQQTRLWNEAVARYGSPEAARKWVAPPGKSNHNHGAAADLAGDLELAHQLAPQFGLVFPMDYEDWHIELAGQRDHADQDAYSTAPAGESYPKEADWSADPAKMAGSLAQSLLGLGVMSPASMTNVANDVQVDAGATDATGGGGGGAPTTTGGNVSPNEVYAALRAQGMDPAAAAALTSIAGRESGFNTGAYNGNAGTGDDSIGLFQINLLNGGWTSFLQAHGMANPREELATLEGATKAASWIYGSSGLHPWGGYKGMPWSYNTDPNIGVGASNGEVTLDDVMGLT